jgi:hypothetical protein
MSIIESVRRKIQHPIYGVLNFAYSHIFGLSNQLT